MSKDFRWAHPNHGCYLCRDYWLRGATPQEVVNGDCLKNLEKYCCVNCIIYKMHLELEKYRKSYADDGK